MVNKSFRLAGWLVLAGCFLPCHGADLRHTISLNGEWQIAEGTLAQLPATFTHKIPVPGLADMATPPFTAPGSTVSLDDRIKPWPRPADPRREAFWYRRTFKLDGALPAVAQLKVHKAFYGTKVFLNGNALGEHGPNFTPGWFDARPFLRANGADNELVIRVGASLAQVPDYLTDGWDNEKSRYIPGIYDSVELILCGTPHVVNVQTVPNVEQRAVRALVELAGATTTPIKVTVREAKSGRIAGEARSATHSGNKVDVTTPIRNARLWTPEDPFLYELVVETSGDTAWTRFGLRTLTTDPVTGRALLNGKPYYLRGSNVCIYRFFEDAVRGGLPWDREWVRKLHQRFKEMHWNSLRYCIGFPPELWYEIADEEGILIQDEFPIWYGRAKDGWPAAITPAHLAIEYTEWMRERWNHPCVAIWDAQNETSNGSVTGPALMAVRDRDLSQRPWDNGWGAPQRPGDISECHPYRSHHLKGLPNFATETGIPNNGPRKGTDKPPYLINEYAWLWINRDGSLPTLTTKVYDRVLGPNATVEQRRQYYARTLAAKTEFWRGKRQCAGVLHFCGLGYSRPDGQTSDNFIDVEKLIFESNFFNYVRDAFAPVGLMLDAWGAEYPRGKKQEFPVVVSNDLDTPWQGDVRLRILRDGKKTITEKKLPAEVAGLGSTRVSFTVTIPEQPGDYQVEATLLTTPCGDVRSLRDFAVLSPEQLAARAGIAIGKPVTASSSINRDGATAPEAAVDGKQDTRWSSKFSDPQWLAVDLGAVTQVSGVELVWEGAYGKNYAIQISTDGQNWTEVYKTNAGKGGTETIRFAPVEARWVRYFGTHRATPYGHSLWEFRIFP